MIRLLLSVWLLATGALYGQRLVYTTANAHSHNDYEKPLPFYEAYRNQFGSIEADIFLLKDSENLYVAHTLKDLDHKRRTLDSLYLLPLVDCIRKNKGFVYADTALKLQLLVDIKTDSIATLKRLIQVLRKYPELTSTSSLQIVISGNRPSPDSFHTYPTFIYFDGIPGRIYSERSLSRIQLMSVSFRQFSKWDGNGKMPANDRNTLSAAIAQSHSVGKPVRFWAAPDTIDAWKQLMELQVDFINTDHILELSKFLNSSLGITTFTQFNQVQSTKNNKP